MPSARKIVFSVAELVGELIELLEASLEEEATVAELAGASPELEAGATALETGVFALDAGTTALEVGVTSALEAGPGTSELDAGTSETTAEDELSAGSIISGEPAELEDSPGPIPPMSGFATADELSPSPPSTEDEKFKASGLLIAGDVVASSEQLRKARALATTAHFRIFDFIL